MTAVVPAAEPVAAGAEAIPLADASVDAATAAQSFHWFRLDRARRSTACSRPGGGLGLVWNERDPDDPFQREVTDLLRPFTASGRRRMRERGWLEALEDSELFGPLDEHTSGFADELDADALVERVRTISFVASGGERERGELEAELRRLADAAGGAVRFVYRTQAFVTFARVERDQQPAVVVVGGEEVGGDVLLLPGAGAEPSRSPRRRTPHSSASSAGFSIGCEATQTEALDDVAPQEILLAVAGELEDAAAAGDDAASRSQTTKPAFGAG